MEVSCIKIWLKNIIKEEVNKRKIDFNSVILDEKKIYHSFDSKNGFDINKMDYERGIFGLGEDHTNWARKHYGANHEFSNLFRPNEFGDTVVEIEISNNAKTYTAGDQTDVLEREFPNSRVAKRILKSFGVGDFGWERKDWHKLDKMIGRYLRKKGYQLIHYTSDQMYGDTWTIIDKSIIKNVKYER